MYFHVKVSIYNVFVITVKLLFYKILNFLF
jgi:hypothetical protein